MGISLFQTIYCNRIGQCIFLTFSLSIQPPEDTPENIFLKSCLVREQHGMQ